MVALPFICMHTKSLNLCFFYVYYHYLYRANFWCKLSFSRLHRVIMTDQNVHAQLHTHGTPTRSTQTSGDSSDYISSPQRIYKMLSFLLKYGSIHFRNEKCLFIFSRVHATLHPALSVRRSVGRSVGRLVGQCPFYFLYQFYFLWSF